MHYLEHCLKVQIAPGLVVAKVSKPCVGRYELGLGTGRCEVSEGDVATKR